MAEGQHQWAHVQAGRGRECCAEEQGRGLEAAVETMSHLFTESWGANEKGKSDGFANHFMSHDPSRRRWGRIMCGGGVC